jgi:hypothetical protein
MNSLNLIDDFGDLEWEEIYPNIFVYRNMLKDPDKTKNILLDSEKNGNGQYFFTKWTPWAYFGTYASKKQEEEYLKAEKNKIFYEQESIVKEIEDSYTRAISHYFNYTKIQIPDNAYLSGHSYCKYFDSVDVLNNNMTMQYHTDFIIAEKDLPGPKFHTTCTFYINDDYEGGEIEFYINEDIVTHKPKAGDIVIFPSSEPYYHGVKTIKSGVKLFIRNFVMNTYKGSDEWLKEQVKHGAYKWAKMEYERIENETNNNFIYVVDDKVVPYDKTIKERQMRGMWKNKNV